jgi:hypothetical protein
MITRSDVETSNKFDQMNLYSFNNPKLCLLDGAKQFQTQCWIHLAKMSPLRLEIDVSGSPFSEYFTDSAVSVERFSPWYSENIPLERETETNGTYPLHTSKIQAVAIVICVTASTAIGTILTGLVTVSTPVIALELGLGLSSRLWSVKVGILFSFLRSNREVPSLSHHYIPSNR